MTKATPKKPARRVPSLPPDEGVVQILERFARNSTWRGEFSPEQSSELAGRATDSFELGLTNLFSASPRENEENFVSLVERVRDPNVLSPSLMKRLGSRLAHHKQWDALLQLSMNLGIQKLKSETQQVPDEVRSHFAVNTLSRERLASDEPLVAKQIKRDLPILATWVVGEDAVALASIFLDFATSTLPKSKLPLAKLVTRLVAVTFPADAVTTAIGSVRSSSLQIATLVDLVAKNPQGSKHAQSLITRIARSKRSEILENDLCWQRLDVMEIAQLTKYPEILSHLSAQPAWWTARQRRELMDEGVGAVLRFVDSTRRAQEVVDMRLLGEFVRDSKRPGTTIMRAAFDSVVVAALAEQSLMHEKSLGDLRGVVAERDAALEAEKAEQTLLLSRILRLEEDLRSLERSEIQSRVQKDVMAQRVMLDLIVELARAMERLRENASEDERIGAFVAEAEALMARAHVGIERDSEGRLVSIRQDDKTGKGTLLYPKP